jgi:hypothetical protein
MIYDVLSFGDWIARNPQTKRREIACVLASRIAMRMVPFLSYSRVFAAYEHNLLMMHGYWRNIIARCWQDWPNRELDLARNAAGIVSFDPQFSHPAAFAAATAEAASSSAFGILRKFDEGSHSTANEVSAIRYACDAARLAVEVFDSEKTLATFVWEAISADATTINRGVSCAVLFSQSLWLNPPPVWSNEAVANTRILEGLEMRQENWGIWLQWYKPITEGLNAFGLRSASTTVSLERAIALGGKDGKFHKEFWDREPGEINREIAEWVAEARATEALKLGQGSGLRFQVRNGLIGLGKYLGLSGPSDDRKRIETNLPQLSELAEILKSALDAREAPYPTLLLKRWIGLRYSLSLRQPT